MTTYASFDYYEGHPGHLTPGKLYKVFNENGKGFCINNDKGMEVYCIWRECAHIHDRNWTRHTEPKPYTPGERQAVAEYPRVKEADTPKLLRDMTDAEIGALVRANNEGKVIECFVKRFGWYEELYTTFDPDVAYRVRPEPKRETVELPGYVDRDHHDHPYFFYYPEADQTHSITFDLIDGKPDCDSIKMEEL